MDQPPVKFNEWLIEGFTVYKQNLGVFITASLITVVLSGVTLGILAGPLMAGMAMVALRLYDGEKNVQPAAVFGGFQHLLNALLFFLVWGLGIGIAATILRAIPYLGQLAAIALVFGASSLLMFGMFLIVDRKMDFWPASLESIAMVRSNLWPFIGFGAFALVAGQIGALLCVVGVFLTLPIQFAMVAVAYREVFSGVATETAAPAFQPYVPPPDPDKVADEAARKFLAGSEVPDEQSNPEIRTWELSEEEIADQENPFTDLVEDDKKEDGKE